MDRGLCESTEDQTGETCRCQASWLICVGDRVYDRQRSCGRHLHSACRAIAAAEGRRGVKLTLVSL